MAPHCHRGPADSKIVLPRKGAKPLLRTVNGTSRAAYDASKKSRVSPATDDDPQSSSDDSDVVLLDTANTNNGTLPSEGRSVRLSDLKVSSTCRQENNSLDAQAKQSNGRNLRSKQDSSRNGAQTQATLSNGTKRSHNEANMAYERDMSKEDDLDMFGELKSSQPNRRVKTFSRAAGKPLSPSPKNTRNIFTKPREESPAKKAKTGTARRSVSDQSEYGRTRQNAGKSPQEGSEGVVFRMPPNLKDVDEISQASSGSQPQFRMRSLENIPNSSADKVPQFKVRSLGDSITSNSTSSPLSSPPTTIIPDSPPAVFDLTGDDCHDNTSLTHTECPMCSAPVSRSFYESFGFGRRLTIREQAMFCRVHKRKDAEDQWRDKGYPDIEWDNFDRRLMQFHGLLQDILNLKRPSYYRDLLAEKVRSGRNRTMMQSMGSDYFEVLKPGYYGSRGARAM